MTEEEMQKLKFPIGIFDRKQAIGSQEIEQWISEIASFPKEVRKAVADLSDVQLSWRYRPDGWTIAQVVHHCSDSHINSLMRFKLALTEDNPSIRPYEEQLWAELADSQTLDLTHSLALLESLHAKWVLLLKNLSDAELTKTFQHPSEKGPTTLAQNIGIYAWHCNHHFAHIKQAIKGGGIYG